MAYLLFFISIGLTTSLFFSQQQTKKAKYALSVAQKQVKESQARLQQTNTRLQQISTKLKETDSKLQETNRKYGGLVSKEDFIKDLDNQISLLTSQRDKLSKEAEIEEREISSKISSLKTTLQNLEEQEFLESFGFYESKYDFQGADKYKHKLDSIRKQQKQMIKDKRAAVCLTKWEVSGSSKEGMKMISNFLKLMLRAFNGECDAAISKVKYNNIQTMENRIRKANADLQKMAQTVYCEISTKYLQLKLQELWLTHEYQEKKYQEQEEQRQIRQQMKEEERARKELEKSRREAEKEEQRYQEALEKARRDLESSTGEAQQELLEQVKELQKRLEEAEANKERAISQAQLTKSGHVYIISNIGSFGEDVYKIGMTRRLEPMDRVKELGDASVPFPFDVHALIYCENAPELETQLHKRFHPRRLNKINERKEFFRVSLDEISKAVHEIDQELQTCKSEIKFTKIAEAADYRKTLAQERM